MYRTKKVMEAGIGLAALTLLLVLLNTPQTTRAQSQAKPSFEVASIKPSEFDGRVGINVQPGRFVANNVTLKFLITMAYDIKVHQISGGPNWLETAAYAIDAKAPGLNKENLNSMIQSLIEERCKLKFHRETRESPVYSLVVAKGGHKLQRSKDENGNPLSEVPREAGRGERRVLRPGDPAPAGTVMVGIGSFSAGATSIDQLVSFLSGPLGRKVIDKTGIVGLYDISLQWSPDPDQQNFTGLPKPPGLQQPAQSGENTGPSIFNAIQEQLGLKLESDKGPVDSFIIDSIEKPSEN
jgi:bla regulator protein blaR1